MQQACRLANCRSLCCWCSIAKSYLTLCDHMDCSMPNFSCPSLSPRVYSDSHALSQWCYLTISSSVVPFSFCLQSFPAPGSFPVSWLFTSSGQSIGASPSASVLPKNIQGWFPLGLTGLTSLLSKGLSRAFSSTTIQKHQFLPLWTLVPPPKKLNSSSSWTFPFLFT